MKSLHIFVNSERPDQYLNSLVYCVLKRDVRRVEFIHIRGLTSARGKAEPDAVGLSGRVLGAVQAQLEGLAERGEYLFKEGPRSGDRVLLKDQYEEIRAAEIQAIYKKCRELAVSYSNDELDYADLRRRLKLIAKATSGGEAHLDVTAIKKRYLGDIIAASLVEGIIGLYTFDLNDDVRPDFDSPWRTLIHDLEPSGAFKYTNMLDTSIYRDCARVVVVRAPRLGVAVTLTVALLIAVALGSWLLGPQHPVTQTIFALSGGASILSLIFMFFTPRGSL